MCFATLLISFVHLHLLRRDLLAFLSGSKCGSVMSHVNRDDPIPRFYGGDNWLDFIETFKAHPTFQGHSKRSCDQDQFKMIMLLLCINDVGPDYYRLDTDSCQTLDELVDKLTE